MKTFAELFKKYRLKAEFQTISSFGDALAEKGYFYEESIFSHWQKGTRTPSDRQLILKILEIFIEREAIKTIGEANEFLDSVGLGYLTDKEKEPLRLHKLTHVPFQVPCEIANFIGREEIIKKIHKEITLGKIFLLYGPPGVGKTALAILLGHILRNMFTDGVLWYKVDSSNVMDILFSIARLFGEDIGGIKDIEVRASIVRTLLADKKVLLIFDNVASQDRLHLLLPNTSSSWVIFTSQEKSLNISSTLISFEVLAFTEEETLNLFTKIFEKGYTTRNKKYILAVAAESGNLPLAIHIAAGQIKKFNLSPQEYLNQLMHGSPALEKLAYEDKDLFRAIGIGFNRLNQLEKKVFISLGLFEGKDFSIEAVAFINNIFPRQTEHALSRLLDISFIEKSNSYRYRIHPTMKIYAREQLTDPTLYLQTAFYYEKLLIKAQGKRSYKALANEVDNIIYVFKKCYEYGYWDEVITLWNPVEKFLSDTNEIKKLRSLAQTIDTSPSVNRLQKIFTMFIIFLVIFWFGLLYIGQKNSVWGHTYSLLFSLFPFLGGLVGIVRSKSWGLFKSNIGKAVLFLSIGLFSWGTGNVIFAYYNFFQNINVPYPSLADIGYFPAYFFWIAGVIYLSKATGTKFDLKQKRGKLFLLVIPLIIIFVSYYFLFVISKRTFDAETPMRIFFDLYYPLMNIIILSTATVILGLSVNFFGGKYRFSLFILIFGFAVLYLADFTFSYTTSLGIYFTGNYVDLFFSIAQYLITWGTLSFYLTPKKKS